MIYVLGLPLDVAENIFIKKEESKNLLKVEFYLWASFPSMASNAQLKYYPEDIKVHLEKLFLFHVKFKESRPILLLILVLLDWANQVLLSFSYVSFVFWSF